MPQCRPSSERYDAAGEPQHREPQEGPRPCRAPSAPRRSAFAATGSIPTHARIWITGVASLQRVPSTTWTKSGATMHSPTSDGIEITPTRRVARSQHVGHPLAVVGHAGECREEHLLQRRRDAGERMRMMFVASAYVPDDAAPRTRPIRRLPGYCPPGRACSPPNTFPANPPSRRRLAIENVERGPPRRQHPEQDRRVAASAELLADDRPRAAKPLSATVIPMPAPTSVAAICRSSSRRNSISRTSRAICVVPSELMRKPTDRATNSHGHTGSP